MEYVFNIKIAEMTFCVTTNYPSSKKLCSKYLIEETGAHSIVITQNDIDNERRLCEIDTEGVDPNLKFAPDAYLETVALLRKLADLITLHNRFLMHGSSIAVDDKGYIFTALSGTGKSTHTRLLREYLGDRCKMINDDKPFLYFAEDQIYICGTPWMGKHKLGDNIMKPLAGIFFLRRSESNVIEKMAPNTALPLLLSQVHRPSDPEKMLNTLDMMDRLLLSVPLYDFGCNMDISAAELSSSVMK